MLLSRRDKWIYVLLTPLATTECLLSGLNYYNNTTILDALIVELSLDLPARMTTIAASKTYSVGN